MLLKSISFESLQLDIFYSFLTKCRFLKEKKKKEQQTLSSQLSCKMSSDRFCAAKSLQATLSLENRNHQSNPAAAPVPALGQTWAFHAGSLVLILQLCPRQEISPKDGGAEAAASTRHCVNNLNINSSTCSCHPGEMQDQPEDFTSNPTCGFVPPNRDEQSETA